MNSNEKNNLQLFKNFGKNEDSQKKNQKISSKVEISWKQKDKGLNSSFLKTKTLTDNALDKIESFQNKDINSEENI